MLWSNPSYTKNPRGIGIYFGPDVANKFLDNELEMLIRSHECKMNGYEINGKVITIFSDPNYCDRSSSDQAQIPFSLRFPHLHVRYIQTIYAQNLQQPVFCSSLTLPNTKQGARSKSGT